MNEYDLEILLEGYSYGELIVTKGKLEKLVAYDVQIRQYHIYNGDILKAVESEKSILPLHKNLDIIDTAMSIKESKVFADAVLGDTQICLN